MSLADKETHLVTLFQTEIPGIVLSLELLIRVKTLEVVLDLSLSILKIDRSKEIDVGRLANALV